MVLNSLRFYCGMSQISPTFLKGSLAGNTILCCLVFLFPSVVYIYYSTAFWPASFSWEMC